MTYTRSTVSLDPMYSRLLPHSNVSCSPELYLLRSVDANNTESGAAAKSSSLLSSFRGSSSYNHETETIFALPRMQLDFKSIHVQDPDEPSLTGRLSWYSVHQYEQTTISNGIYLGATLLLKSTCIVLQKYFCYFQFVPINISLLEWLYCFPSVSDSNSKPKVECSVVTEFTDHICVTMDAELIMFLHDLVSAYLKEKEKGESIWNVNSSSTLYVANQNN